MVCGARKTMKPIELMVSKWGCGQEGSSGHLLQEAGPKRMLAALELSSGPAGANTVWEAERKLPGRVSLSG